MAKKVPGDKRNGTVGVKSYLGKAHIDGVLFIMRLPLGRKYGVKTWQDCLLVCMNFTQCHFWQWESETCVMLKSFTGYIVDSSSEVISGPSDCVSESQAIQEVLDDVLGKQAHT